jgi:hypothetical protein
MSLPKLSLGGNKDVIYKLFLPRESLVSDITAGDGNIEKLFLRCLSNDVIFVDLSGCPILNEDIFRHDVQKEFRDLLKTG